MTNHLSHRWPQSGPRPITYRYNTTAPKTRHPVRILLFVLLGLAVAGALIFGGYLGTMQLANYLVGRSSGSFAPSPTYHTGVSASWDPSDLPWTQADPGVTLTIQKQGEEPITSNRIYQQVLPSVVCVTADQGNGSASVGSGVVTTASGYIVTNFHIIEGGVSLEVSMLSTQDSYEAQVVGYDEELDLAVLKVEADNLTPAQLASSDQLAVGDPVYAIGNPLGLELRSTFTDGIVSAVNRDVDVDGVIMTLIQTNAALNSGNSGGPLINQYGQVVGINTIKMMSGYDTLEGLGFAIPTSLAQRWVNELIEYGELQPQPLLGLTISRIPEVLNGELTGLRVEEVSPGLGGEAAGVEVGDYILSFNGQEITRIEQILSIRQTLSVGDMVEIQVWRDGEILTLTMEMMAGE